MATANNTIKTRIQLKSDTEANWNKAGPKDGSNGFVPLSGELIVYTADATHPFSRLKVGNGVTNVVDLPFIDAGTLNGTEVELVKKENFAGFPSLGSPDKLYVDLSTKIIYCYSSGTGYTLLSNFSFSVDTSTILTVVSWQQGYVTTATYSNNTLVIIPGSSPYLGLINLPIVTSVTKGGN